MKCRCLIKLFLKGVLKTPFESKFTEQIVSNKNYIKNMKLKEKELFYLEKEF